MSGCRPGAAGDRARPAHAEHLLFHDHYGTGADKATHRLPDIRNAVHTSNHREVQP